jgi:hypothetical protein
MHNAMFSLHYAVNTLPGIGMQAISTKNDVNTASVSIMPTSQDPLDTFTDLGAVAPGSWMS